MTARTQLACIWAGLVGMILFGVGFIVFAGMVPPPSPSSTALAIQAFYLSNTTGIRIGLLLSMLGGSLTGPFIVAISEQMRRIEGERSPLAWINLAMGTCGVMLFVVPLMLFEAVEYRPLRDAGITQTLHDTNAA